MARLFNDAAPEYLYINSGILTAVPVSMSCWFNCDDAAIYPTPIFLADKDVGTEYLGISCRGAAQGNKVRAVTSNGGTAAYAETSTAWSANTWHHVCAVFASNTDRRIYLDGGGKGTNATNVVPANIDRFCVGFAGTSTPSGYMSGDIAEVALWNTALTDDDAASLAKHISPFMVKQQNLAGYWPLVRGLVDRTYGYTLTASGTVVSAHSRIIYPSSPMGLGISPSAAPPSTGMMTCNTGYWGSI